MERRAERWCSLVGDDPVATKLKLSLLAIEFVAVLTVGVLATQVSAPESCSLASSDGSADGADPCCLATSSWDDVVDAAHSCGAWTILEAVVLLLSGGLHVLFMVMEIKKGDGLGGVIAFFFKLASGGGTIAVTCGVAGFALYYLVNLRSSIDDLSDYGDCGGNEDLGQIEQVSVALMVVYSVVLIRACCLTMQLVCIDESHG